MQQRDKIESINHYIMSSIGGFLGLYALLNRCDNFGSSQTSNLLYIVEAVLGSNFIEVLIRLGAVFLYMLATFLVIWLPKKFKINVRILAVFVDLFALVLLGFLPKDMNNVLGLYPIFFAASFQWNSFCGARGYNSSSIFSTNNLRQFTMAVTEVFVNKNRIYADKAKFFGMTLLSYHIGAVVSYFAW